MKMYQLKSKNVVALLLLTFFFLAAPFFSAQQIIFAGDSGCQSGSMQYHYNKYSRPSEDELKQQEQRFQAAQVRNGGGGGVNQPPTAGGLKGNDSEARSIVSYFAALFLLGGGIWLLVSLLRERFGKNPARRQTRAARVCDFALKPSFALSVFAVLFVSMIFGSVLTAPRVSSAQTERDRGELNRVAPDSPAAVTNQPVFGSAQQLGGAGGTTQIGAPVYDGYGNYYVRGAFSGTLTLGGTTLTATQGMDLFFAKFDQNQNLLWARQGSGISNAPDDDLAVEGATALGFNGTDVYLAGSFVKRLTLPGGANPSVTLNDNGAPGYNYETFVAKYDQDGNLIWARGGNSGSPKNPNNLEVGQNSINRILFDRNGSPYLAGIISGGNFLGTPISNFTCNTNQPCQINGKSDVLLAYLDGQTGTPTGVKIIGGAGDDNALDLAVDNVTDSVNPKFYLIGISDSPQINFSAPTGGGIYTNADSSISTFILKFEANDVSIARDGVWVKFLDNNALVGVNQIVTDPVNGVPYVTGYYKGTLTAQNGPSLTNNRTGTGEEALAGFVAQVSTADGSFYQLAGLGGAGKSLVIRPGGNIFVVGSLYDTGTFTNGGQFGGTAQTLDAYGGNDLFVAELNKFNFEFASMKAVAGTGYQGLVAVGDPSASDGRTKNAYSPLAVTLDNVYRVVISGDFSGTLSLDCLTLQTPAASRHAYIAKFLGANETTSCRVWTNTDPSNRNWNVQNNWNGGTIPTANDSVYVPYRKVAQYNPIYNPSNNVTLSGLSVADNQTLVLQQNLSLSDRLDLLGGIVNAGSGNQVNLGSFAEVLSNNNGRVIGKLIKQFSAAPSVFTFPVGTANGYSPVTLSNVSGAGSFAVTANQNTYPNQATDLPANRAARWWNLTNGGLTKADLKFQYLDGDIASGTESSYRAYRIPAGGGAATYVGSNVDTATKTVIVPNVTEFSDWTLAQPAANALTITGTALYGTTPSGQPAKFVPNVQLSAVGTNSAVASTDSSGKYSLESLNPGGQYTVAASKTGDANGITAFDATIVLRCVAAGSNCQLTANQKLAADADNNSVITAFDATQILRYVAAMGQNETTGKVGNWKFVPPSFTHAELNNSITDDNFMAILVGEVDGNWTASSQTVAAEIEPTSWQIRLQQR